MIINVIFEQWYIEDGNYEYFSVEDIMYFSFISDISQVFKSNQKVFFNNIINEKYYFSGNILNILSKHYNKYYVLIESVLNFYFLILDYDYFTKNVSINDRIEGELLLRVDPFYLRNHMKEDLYNKFTYKCRIRKIKKILNYFKEKYHSIVAPEEYIFKEINSIIDDTDDFVVYMLEIEILENIEK